MDVVHSPHLIAVCDSYADSCQLNADVHHHNAESGFELCSSSPAVNVCRSLPVSENTECVASAAGQSQPSPLGSAIEDQSVDEQCHLTECTLTDFSSVLVEQTLVGTEISCHDAAQLTQYTLYDSLSDASVHAVEMLQFPLDNTPDNVVTAVQCEVDNATLMDRDNCASRVELQESGVERDGEPVQWCSVDDASLPVCAVSVSANDSYVTCSNAAAAAVTSCSGSQDNRCDVDTDLLVSISTTSKNSSSSSAVSAAFSKTTDSSTKMVESDDSCLASGTSLSALSPSHMKQSDYTGTLTEKARLGSTTVTAVDLQLDRVQSVTVIGPKTVPAEDNISGIVTDLHGASSSAVALSLPAVDYSVQPTGNKSLDSGQASSSASVELGCVGQRDDAGKMSDVSAVVSGGGRALQTDLELSADHQAGASAVRKIIGITCDVEQTGNQVKTLCSDDAQSLRNVADGSEASDAPLSTVTVSGITAAVSRSHCVSYDSVNSLSRTAENSGTVMHGHTMSDDHRPRDSVGGYTNRDKTEISAQHSTTMTQKSSDMGVSYFSLPLEQDSGSEFDEDDLGDNVKMILAKYRIRRGPIGSDSTSAASSAKVDNVLMLDADDPVLPSGWQKDSSTARDVDACSDSSDDTLASRVKALLLKEQRDSSSKVLRTMSQNSSKVASVSSSRSRSTPVDYSSLSRELDEIEMNLVNMRNNERSSSGSQQSSASSPHVYNPVTDASMVQESLGVLVQQKTCLDQLLQRSLVGHAGDGLHTNYCGFVSEADAATSGVKQVEASTLRRELVPSGHVHEMSPALLSSIGGTAEPFTALKTALDSTCCWDSGASALNRDVLQTTTNVTTVERHVVPPKSSSNCTAYSLMAVPGMSFSDKSLHKSFDSLASRSELITTTDEVEDTMSSVGSQNQKRVCARKLPLGQNVNMSDSDREVLVMSDVEDVLLDTLSEVSSLRTDMRQSEHTSCTQLDDWRPACSESTSVEAAVKKLEQNLSNLIQTSRHDTSSDSNVYSYIREAELLKHSSEEARVNQQIPALSDDEYYQSGTGLSRCCSDSCGLSPVPKHSSFNVMRSSQLLPAMQLDRVTAARLDMSTELVYPAAHSDSSVTQSFDTDVQQIGLCDHLRIEHEKRNDCEIPHKSISCSDTSTSQYMMKSYLLDSSDQKVHYGAQSVSTAHLQFMPLPCGRDSSISESYDGDNERPLTDQQSDDGDSQLRSYSGDVVEQRLTAHRTVSSCDVDVGVSCLDAGRNTQTDLSHSLADMNLLQPYQ